MDLRELKVEEKPEDVDGFWPPIERHLYHKPHNFHKKASVWEIVFITLFPILLTAVFLGTFMFGVTYIHMVQNIIH